MQRHASDLFKALSLSVTTRCCAETVKDLKLYIPLVGILQHPFSSFSHSQS